MDYKQIVLNIRKLMDMPGYETEIFPVIKAYVRHELGEQLDGYDLGEYQSAINYLRSLES